MARSGALVAGGTPSSSSLRRGRGLAVGGAAIAATLLVFAAASFACSPAVGSSSITPTEGATGSKVLVQGWGYSAPVEIRWGSSTGPLLAQVIPASSTISQSVTIPASDPGFYSIVVTSFDPVTSQPIKSSSTFKVLGSAAAPDPGATEPAPADPAPAPSTATPAASASGPAATPAAPAAATTSAAAPAPSPASSPAPQPTSTSGSAPAASAPATSAASPAARVAASAVSAAPTATAPPSAVTVGSPQPAIAAAPVAPPPADSPARVEALPQPWSSAPAQSHGLFDATTPDSRPLGAEIVFLAVGFAASLAFAAVVGRHRLVRAKSQVES